MGNSTSRSSGKTSPQMAKLKADRARLEKERKALDQQLLNLAAQADKAGKPAKRKRSRPKHRKKEWACGIKVPDPDFPLTPHRSGVWVKKIRGKIHYFGRWAKMVDGELVRLPGDGIAEARKLYAEQKDDLLAGRTPRKNDGSPTVKYICNKFLTAKQRKVDSGELAPRTHHEYQQTAKLMADFFGSDRLVSDLRAGDFEELRAVIAKRLGPVRLGNEIVRVKSVFKYSYDNGVINEQVRFGSEFNKPRKEVMLKHRAARAKKLFAASELRQMLKALKPHPQLTAIVLLGINAALGNTDIAKMEFRHLDLNAGWLNYPRPKSGIDRRVPLWSETVQALREVLTARPEPTVEADANIVFITPRLDGEKRMGGTRWVVMGKTSRADYVGREFARLLRDLKINGREGLGFYSLRHTFATQGKESKDRDAVKAIMGHAFSDTVAGYIETGPSDDRLLAVTNCVHDWLFGRGGAK